MATITVTDLAEALNTDGRTTRKFLRAITPKEDQPGKGSRWLIEKREVRSLKSKFAKWDEARTAKAEPSTKEAEIKEIEELLEPVGAEVEVEPTAEDLAEIELED